MSAALALATVAGAFLIRSKLDHPFRRDGVEFPDDAWRYIENPTKRQVDEPSLHCIPFNGLQDPALRGLPVLDAPENEANAEAVGDDRKPFDAELDDYLNREKLSLVKAADLAGFQTDLDKLKGDLAVATTAKQTAERQLEAEQTAKKASDAQIVALGAEKGLAERALAEAQSKVVELESELAARPSIDPNPALIEAIDAVLANAVGNLERLSEETLQKLAKAKGHVLEGETTKAKLIELLKAPPAA